MESSSSSISVVHPLNGDLEFHISLVPAEILLRIFRSLEKPTDLLNVMLVCKHFNALVQDQKLWKRLCLKKQKICRIESYKGDWRQYYREQITPLKPAVNRILVQGGKYEQMKYFIVDPKTKQVFGLPTTSDSKHLVLQQGTWSPGGDKIAITKMIAGSDDRDCEIAILNPDAKEIACFKSPYPSFYYYWSPDNTRLLFLSNYQTPEFGYDIGLQYIDMILSKEKSGLFDIGRPYYFSWQPFGRPEIIAHIGGHGLFVLEFGGETSDKKFNLNKKTVLRTDPQDPKKGYPIDLARFPAPFWVPQVGSLHQTEFIYAIQIEDNVVNTNKKPTLVSATPRPPVSELEWGLMSVKSLKEYLDFYKVDYSGAVEKSELIDLLKENQSKLMLLQEKPICSLPSASVNIVVSKDGTKIAFDADEKSLFVIDRKAQNPEPKKLTNQVFGYFWSPNSRYLLYLILQDSFTSNEMECWIYDSQTQDSYLSQQFRINREFANNYLPFFTQYSQSLTLFSPDSQQYVICDEGKVYVCSVEKGSKRESLCTGVFATWSPR